jgi:hypothetical protein
MNYRPLAEIIGLVLLVAVLVGAAWIAGAKQGYQLGRYDREQHITVVEQ